MTFMGHTPFKAHRAFNWTNPSKRAKSELHQQTADFGQGCDDLVETSAPGKFARRPLLRAAVLGQPEADCQHGAAYASLLNPPPDIERTVVTGLVEDVSPHVIILHTADGEERLVLTPVTTVWRGSAVAPTALRAGDRVIVRKRAPGRGEPGLPAPGFPAPGFPAQWPSPRRAAVQRTVVERVWAGIGRATGTIIETDGRALLVDEGPAKGRRIVLIGSEVHQQILVRFPKMEPGYLIDVIGLAQPGFLQALIPATAQPAYRADHPPAPPLATGEPRVRAAVSQVSGTAVWHEPGEEPSGLAGLAYPALDPETCCSWGQTGRTGQPSVWPDEPHVVDPHSAGPGCVRLPYLSAGSIVTVRNECTGQSAPLPVTGCAAAARLFCDRCVDCGASVRGRIADLTMTAFVELGGRLEDGCFNASLMMSG